MTKFRDIPFGANLSELNDMVLFRKGLHEDWYKRTNEKLTIGHADIQSITYGFFRKQLTSIVVDFRGDATYTLLTETLRQKYGIRSRQEGRQTCIWSGVQVNITIEYNEITNRGTISYFYIPLKDEERHIKERAREGMSDF